MDISTQFAEEVSQTSVIAASQIIRKVLVHPELRTLLQDLDDTGERHPFDSISKLEAVAIKGRNSVQWVLPQLVDFWREGKLARDQLALRALKGTQATGNKGLIDISAFNSDLKLEFIKWTKNLNLSDSIKDTLLTVMTSVESFRRHCPGKRIQKNTVDPSWRAGLPDSAEKVLELFAIAVHSTDYDEYKKSVIRNRRTAADFFNSDTLKEQLAEIEILTGDEKLKAKISSEVDAQLAVSDDDVDGDDERAGDAAGAAPSSQAPRSGFGHSRGGLFVLNIRERFLLAWRRLSAIIYRNRFRT